MKCPHCKKDIKTAQAINAVQKFIHALPPDIVPQAMAARVRGVSRQAIQDRIRKGKLQTIDVHGENWVSLSDIPERQAPSNE